MSGLHPLVLDAERMVNGRQHDTVSSLYDVVGPVSALPTDRAKIICVGTLIDTHGFVAEDRRSVYTGFTFKISTLYKSDDKSLHPGDIITADRLGARVHFQSGHIRDYVVEGEGIPKIGREYVLFLWRSGGPSGEGYGITTAYEIQNGIVYALDFRKPFTVYEGAKLSDFSAELATSLRKTGGN